MEPIFFVMAIMGCGDSGSACAEARIDPARFRTIQACQAAMPVTLERNTDLAYPVISATCRATGTRMAEASTPQRG